MGKFNKSGKKGMPELNTSSLPDLIFTMLFFFMIVTTMREVSLLFDSSLHTIGYVIGIKDCFTADISCRSSDCLNQCPIAS